MNDKTAEVKQAANGYVLTMDSSSLMHGSDRTMTVHEDLPSLLKALAGFFEPHRDMWIPEAEREDHE